MISPIRSTQFVLWRIGRVLWRLKWWVLGLSMGFGVLALLAGFFMCTGCGGPRHEAKIQIGNYEQLVHTYYLTTDPHELPTRLEDLTTKKYLAKKIRPDPWGNPYVYLVQSDREFIIVSRGADEMLGTRDDITEDSMGHHGEGRAEWLREFNSRVARE